MKRPSGSFDEPVPCRIKKRIKSQPSAAPPTELQNELNAVSKELVVFQERFATKHPDLLLRVGPARPLTHANLDSLVRARTSRIWNMLSLETTSASSS